ncbi:hypothetical protein [Gordonia tangerina]|uniref:CARDB domain-containing protein n=1 Tax=Gordonia tangerina TaxID=2911060 RepID=A0ABS9DM21_9ACTN|nr:hypothetical protein [Gordonia tangerina]MCF3940202.1 hypothetical protein [Gordonia tangerina]
MGLAFSAVQIWQASAPKPADLEVAMSSVAGPQSVPAVSYDRIRKVAGESTPFSANPIDITLKNNGDRPALITAVIADVKHLETLADCTGSGAGPAGISAEYSIKIPTQPPGAALGPHQQDVRFEVKPGAVDRMSLTIGPEIESFYNYPYVVGVDVKLVHDGGAELDAGSYAIVTNHKAVEEHIANSSDEACAQKNLEVLETIYAYQSIKSSELDQLRDNYRALAAG